MGARSRSTLPPPYRDSYWMGEVIEGVLRALSNWKPVHVSNTESKQERNLRQNGVKRGNRPV